jgi:beta-galactosidase
MDELGDVRAQGFAWQAVWGAATTTAPSAGNGTAVSVVADHTAITTDVNDISFVRAGVGNGGTATVTFAITGPGVITAVDSGGMTQSTFRGNSRAAYNGFAYALVQATGAGTITVTASAPGMTSGTATIQGSVGTFVPCSGACD